MRPQRTKPRTTRQRIKRALIATSAMVLAITLGIAGLGAAWLSGYRVPFASGATYLSVQKLTTGHADEAGSPTAPFFVLLVGNDDRPGVGGARGDALHLLGVNPTLHKATMFNIPRDTCWNGDKINSANAEGGAPAQAAAVGGLVGVPVSYAVDVNFDGFQSLVDAVGGITLDVPVEMNDSYSGAYFHPGVQHLDSAQALAFSRDRHDFPQSDIIRTGNQGLLIIAAVAQLQKEVTDAGGQFRLISLVYHLYPHVQLAGLGLNDLFRLGRVMYDIPPDQIRSVTIPIGSGGCLGLDSGAQGLFADFGDDAVLETH